MLVFIKVKRISRFPKNRAKKKGKDFVAEHDGQLKFERGGSKQLERRYKHNAQLCRRDRQRVRRRRRSSHCTSLCAKHDEREPRATREEVDKQRLSLQRKLKIAKCELRGAGVDCYA